MTVDTSGTLERELSGSFEGSQETLLEWRYIPVVLLRMLHQPVTRSPLDYSHYYIGHDVIHVIPML